MSQSEPACIMNEYLKTTIEKLRSNNYATLHIVMGNESCDLDSAVCALSYAFFLNWQHWQMQCKVCTRNKRTEEVKDDIFIPLLNINQEDYEIKTEVAYVFQSHGIEKENLVFKDDPILPSPLKANITLVDHHVFSEDQKDHLAPFVTEIIDHRPLDKTQKYKEDTRITIELVGSCATLVAQRIMDLSALFAKDVDFFMTNVAICDMLHSTIILDTVNCSAEVNKATPHDEEMLLYLETILKPQDYKIERANKLDSLVNARRDVTSLSAAQLLRKDTKILDDILVPSFPMLVKEFLSRDGGLAAVSAALGPLGPGSAALLLGMELSGGLARDMAIYCTDKDRRDSLSAFLQAWIPSLDLHESPDLLPDRSELRYFTQRNLTASRKQYMPALKAFLEQK